MFLIFFQKHFVSATNVSPFARTPRKQLTRFCGNVGCVPKLNMRNRLFPFPGLPGKETMFPTIIPRLRGSCQERR